MELNSSYLFVYGTLKSDAKNANANYLHENAVLIGEAKWPGSLYLVSNYPGAVRSNQGDRFVIGELWKLNDADRLLSTLDEYEECAPSSPEPHEYIRSLELVACGKEEIQAWVYIYNLEVAHLQMIESGNFSNQNQQLIRRPR